MIKKAALPAAVAVTVVSLAVAVAPNASAVSHIRLTAIYFDSPGSDTGTNQSLNAEWVKIKNTTGHRKALTGWTLRDSGSSTHVYHFPTFHLAAGAAVKVHTGHGTDGAHNLYWGATGYIWNNDGDAATLKNANGVRVDRCSYTSADDPEVFC